MNYYSNSIKETLKDVNSTETGLTETVAEERLLKDGKNKLKENKKTPLIVRFFKQLVDPMIIILLCAAAVSLVISIIEKEGFADVIIIVAVVLLNAILGVVQESKAEQAIAALQEMTASTCKVIRDGKQITIKSQDVVVGDIIVLEAGDSVSADARIIECASMKVEEAALTGESVPSEKTAEVIGGEKDVPLGDRKNMVYMGSTVVYGRGKVVVVATGMNTEMGKIADVLSNAAEEKTPLQKKLSQLSRVLTYLVLGICVVIFAFKLLTSLKIAEDLWRTVLDSFIVAVSLAVAAIPEGLATVVTIVLSIGVTNMSRKNAVIRKLTAVETLGCAQVICSDKTGTLTQNKMTVTEYYGDDQMLLAKAMSMCSDAETAENGNAVGEPTECALVNYAFKLGIDKREIIKSSPRIGEAPFDSMRKMMSTLHQDGNIVVQYTKGAPDEILKNCTRVLIDGKVEELTDKKRKEISAQNKGMADKALRVLSVAYKEYDKLPTDLKPENIEKELIFIGLTGMIDPVRPEVLGAIKECRQAGIRPIMITGDHIDTAVAIATELGIIKHKSEAITGAEMAKLSDEEFEKAIEKYSVYARVQPEHKVRIVNMWKKKGMVTAMTGDGVNDAPSIKSADIGIGMGITGTDVTKNTADMVLADDNFATIIIAVAEGRRIYDNIRKSIQFLLSSNLSEVIGIFAATLFGVTLLKPVHLLWINLITDTFPALALGMEKEEPDIMRRPPRNSKEGIFAGGMAIHILLQGLFVAVLTLLAYFIGHGMEVAAQTGKFVWEIPKVESPDGITMAFLTMSMAEMFHAFNVRSRDKSLFVLKKQNVVMWGAFALSLLLTTLVIYVPFLRDAFGFTSISVAEYFVAMALAILIIPAVEIAKLAIRFINSRESKNQGNN